jgi:Trk K+ transport system NAD-binding subunit
LNNFPELLAVAIIRDQQIQLPRGSTQIKGGDQLLIVASETTSIDDFKRLAANSLEGRPISEGLEGTGKF